MENPGNLVFHFEDDMLNDLIGHIYGTSIQITAYNVIPIFLFACKYRVDSVIELCAKSMIQDQNEAVVNPSNVLKLLLAINDLEIDYFKLCCYKVVVRYEDWKNPKNWAHKPRIVHFVVKTSFPEHIRAD
jgi:hypothetical protein